MSEQDLEAAQAQLGTSPERLYTIDMTVACSKFVYSMMHLKISLIAKIGQTIISAPSLVTGLRSVRRYAVAFSGKSY
jgi:hypothetical protein